MTSDQLDLVLGSLGPLVGGAIRGTIPLAVTSFALGLALAVVFALMRIARRPWMRRVAATYISAIRGTPLLVQLFVIFYGLPTLGLVIDPWPSAIIAFSLNVGGYGAEVVRGAINAVPHDQWEAGYALGVTRGSVLRHVILPQAARLSIPPLANSFISLVKDTSLASSILVTEMFREAQKIAAFSQEFLLLYIEAALVYWVICLGLATVQSRLEHKFAPAAVR